MVTIITERLRGSLELCGLEQNEMKANMGSADRIIRLLIAAVVVALYFTNTITGTLGIVLMVLAAVFALTSFVSFCPLYAPFKFSTLKK